MDQINKVQSYKEVDGIITWIFVYGIIRNSLIGISCFFGVCVCVCVRVSSVFLGFVSGLHGHACVRTDISSTAQHVLTQQANMVNKSDLHHL